MNINITKYLVSCIYTRGGQSNENHNSNLMVV